MHKYTQPVFIIAKSAKHN